MSSFAKTKCPKCGNITAHHLGGLGFYGQLETRCKKCGYTYDSVHNCIEDIPDRRDDITDSIKTTNEDGAKHLSDFSTK